MGRTGEKLDVDFVISTGDNFYDKGLIDEHDPAFEESFTNIYTATSLQKPWYTGNLHPNRSPFSIINNTSIVQNIRKRMVLIEICCGLQF